MKKNNIALNLSSDTLVAKWAENLINRHFHYTENFNGVEPQWTYLIPEYRLKKTFAKLMNVIESIGLPERQEKAIRGQIRDVMFEINDDSYAMLSENIKEIIDANIPASVFAHYQPDENKDITSNGSPINIKINA